MEIRYIKTDLLIIGGGSAGCMAAIRALDLQPDLDIVIFEKGDIKYSGSIARGMDALNIVAIPNFTTPELYVEAITAACEGVVDAPSSYVMADRSYGLLKKLESWGVYFPVDANGNYRTLKYHVKGNFQTDMEEPDLKTIISRMVQEKGARAINRTMGLTLLKDDERIAGAIGLNVRNGEIVVCQSKAVIITAGGQARFTLPNSGDLYGVFDYPGNTGDGYIMAYKAGAALTGMEYSMRAVLVKDANFPLLAIAVNRGGRVMDIYDKIIMENDASTWEDMNKAITEDRGPLRIRLSHLSHEIIEEIEHILFTTERPVNQRFFKQRGIDFRKRDIELWPIEWQLCGGHGLTGVYINEKAETGLPGLYVAGDVACVPKQHLTGAFVFGEVAAERAVEFISKNQGVKLNDSQVKKAEEERDKRFSTTGRDINVRDLEYKVRRLIADYVVSPKNEYKLSRWLEWGGIFQNEIESQVSIRNGHELSKLYEIENIVHCANLSARASLERKESRMGSHHQRVDYPEKDVRNWFRHILLKRGDNLKDIQASTRAVIGLDGKEVTP